MTSPLEDAEDARALPRVGILAGHWSPNLGNAFFQLGARRLIEGCGVRVRTLWLPELPGYQSPGIRNPAGTLDPALHWEIDLLVALGPFLRPEFERVLHPTLISARSRGIPVIALGTGMMDYAPESVARYAELLDRAEVRFVATRDRRAFELLTAAGVEAELHDGVDVAFFLPEAVPPTPLRTPPELVLNFDKEPEPELVALVGERAGWRAGPVVEIGGGRWGLRPRPFGRRLASSGRVGQFLSTWLPAGRTPAIDRAVRVVRTDHRFNPIVLRRAVAHPETLWTDIPEPYLNLYAATELTLSNRVHACAATLAYGNRAMLFSASPRAALLDRVGASAIRERPVSLDLDRLAREKEELSRAVAETLLRLLPGARPSPAVARGGEDG